jgi:hypothetical protein
MIGIALRIGLLTLGFGAVELGLPPALGTGSIGDWALTALGLLLLVAGSAGFIGPLLQRPAQMRDHDRA